MDFFLIALGAALLFVAAALVVAVPVLSLLSRRAMRRVTAPFTDLGHPDPVQMMMAHPMVAEVQRLGRPMRVVNVALIVVTGSLGVSLLAAGTDRSGLAAVCAALCAAGVAAVALAYRRHVAGIERFAQLHDLELSPGGHHDDEGGETLFRPMTP